METLNTTLIAQNIGEIDNIFSYKSNSSDLLKGEMLIFPNGSQCIITEVDNNNFKCVPINKDGENPSLVTFDSCIEQPIIRIGVIAVEENSKTEFKEINEQSNS